MSDLDEPNSTPVEKDENSGKEISIPENMVLIFKGAKAIPLNQLITSIGRSHDNTVVIDDPRISRHHMEIRFIQDHFVIFDLKSTGGTFVNGQRVEQGIIYPGDLISLAGIDLVFTQDKHMPRRDRTGTNPLGPGDHPTADFFSSTTDKDIK